MADDVSPPNPEAMPGPTDAGHDSTTALAVQSPPADTPTVVEPPAPPPESAPAAPPETAAAAAAKPEPEPEPEPAEPEGKMEEPPPPPENKKRWYVVKVQSGREDTIKEAIERRVHKEGLEEYFGQIVIPVEKVTEIKQDKNGRRVTRTKEKKLYPGYLMVEVEYNDRILYLFRETSGVGDFVGAQPGHLDKPPTPMSAKEVQRMLGPQAPEAAASQVPAPPPLSMGDRVQVVDGTFKGMEGFVKQILEAQGKVQVEVTIFGRPVAVELDYYQVEEA